MNIYFKKRIAILFIMLIVMPSLLFVPTRAHAIWGIIDTSIDFPAIAIAIKNFATEAIKWAKENWQKLMRDVIAKRIIDYMVDETIKWVQGGGEPSFISDWDGFIKDAEEMAFDSVIKELELTDLCQPFASQLRIALIPQQRFAKEPVTCTIDDVVANVQDFYNNFQNGGWLAYGEAIKPENNLYMQLVMQSDKIKLESAFNQTKSQQQAATGQGFLSVSKCVQDDSEELFSQCINDGGNGEECREYATQNATCSKSEVQTPGATVGNLVSESLSSDKEWAANISSWTSALVNAAINRVTQEGIAAMTGSKPDATPDYDPASSEYGDLKDAEMTAEQQGYIDRVETITTPYGQVLAEKQKAKGYTEQILDIYAQIGLLDTGGVCVPQMTTAEVAQQQAILKPLSDRINLLQPVITEGEDIITQIKSIGSNVRAGYNAAALVAGFESKHNADEQTAVKQEIMSDKFGTDSSKQLNTLQQMQSRYTQCKEKISLLAAQAAATSTPATP